MSSPESSTSHAFKAETKELLDIVIHSLYSNKEIFLRELISNASDALDRLRFEGLTTPGLLEDGEVLEIRLEVDEEKRTLSVSDNGIGMSREEVVENLGTIAKSGTREVAQRLHGSESAEQIAQLIGQFGVGFYSAFMVSDSVTVVTRRAGEEAATRWTSSGEGDFEVDEDHRFLRGTTVTLHLKPAEPDAGVADFASFDVLSDVVRRYSDFIPYPIRARRPPAPEEKGLGEETTLNSMKPIWTREDSDVSDEERHEFYRHIAHDWSEPLSHLSLRAEGRIEYRALLFVPSRAPFDLFWRDQQVGLQLYVKRVLIMDRCEELLPPWLRFVRGVVDSSDLQLNVSRELLQQDRHILQMRKWITRKVLDHLATMKKQDFDTYLELWNEFGRVLKEGVAGDPDNAERLQALLLFSYTGADGLSDLDSYIERMPEEQSEIYYLCGESRALLESSPHLEALRERGYEALLLTDPIDEIMVQHLADHGGKKLRSAAEADIDLPDDDAAQEDKNEDDKEDESFAPLLAGLQKQLDDTISEVRLSRRLRKSPACLVTAEGGMSPQLERLLRQTEGADGIPSQKRILEINAEHPAIGRLKAVVSSEPDSEKLADHAHLLLSYALLAEGSDLPDPGRFNRLLAELMTSAL
jgi:molecular chaperone HtpG